jgi:hypothetical protein
MNHQHPAPAACRQEVLIAEPRRARLTRSHLAFTRARSTEGVSFDSPGRIALGIVAIRIIVSPNGAQLAITGNGFAPLGLTT